MTKLLITDKAKKIFKESTKEPYLRVGARPGGCSGWMFTLESDTEADMTDSLYDDFDFTYIKYEGDVPCENINIALDNCEGRIIKIMFSDDIFVKKNALELIHDEYNKLGCKWAFSGFSNWDNDGLFDEKIPEWTPETVEGRNLLSSPSVVSFLNECKVEFDEELKLLLDVDFYHRMRMKNGKPFIIPDVLVANRDHDDRISSDATSKYDCIVEHPEGNWVMNSKELQYVRDKYSDFFPTRKYPDEK